MSRKDETLIILKCKKKKKNQKDPIQKEAKEKLINDDNKEPNLKEVRSSRRQKRNPVMRMSIFHGQ